MKKEKGKGNKSELIFGIIGTILSIAAVATVKTSTYQEFFQRTWITVFMYVAFILPVLTSGISAFLSNNKD